MRIEILRHGDAVPHRLVGGADPHRHLSELGRQQARAAGAFLSREAGEPGLIWTSPLTRAVQTAELVAASRGATAVVESKPVLAFGGCDEVLEAVSVDAAPAAVLLVGHLPVLGDLLRVLTGSPSLPDPSPGEAFVLEGAPAPGGCKLVAEHRG